ncbi:MAG TPA: YjjG family noncanonical pyrimidine nucleotidase [Cyclobacteriaceae bacterium]|nr:YjjG family noncanonical pyrimidine nucleotidase [Cyclobacteriaceae bacterium]
MLKYRHILFDLDHTLWDFERNSIETLQQLYEQYRISELRIFSIPEFTGKFREVNRRLWNLYDLNKIDRDYLRDERFRLVLTELGLKDNDLAAALSRDYLSICPAKEHVIPHAFEVLDYLKGRYQLHIITNGFVDVQHLKLTYSRLEKYFTNIITSESAGHKKPDRGIFDYAMEIIGTGNRDCIMVGDSIETDIRGAVSYQMDIIFFNPDRISHDEKVTHEITSLAELKDIL